MSKEYILLVEDSKVINRGVTTLLKRELDFEVLSCLDFKECKEAIEKYREKIVIAITDLNLPDAPDGAATDCCLENKIPTVVLTGNYDENLRENLYNKHVTDYFLKENSNSLRQVVLAIKRILKNRETKIMVVDDSKTYLSYYRDVLNKQLFKPLFAKNGKEALRHLKNEENLKLVITEYNMEEMNGLELTQKIRKDYSKDDLAIIAISDDKSNQTPAKFLKHGANDFVSKPFSNEEFITRINSNLEILELFQEANDRANKDFMTGMFNRRYFFDEGREEYEKVQKKELPLYAAMIDIDKFKNINDTYGHDVGDVAIKEIPKVLERNLKEYNPIIARFGGEEFCILLKNLDKEKVKELYENIRADFENNVIHINDIELKYTVSIGVCSVENHTLEEAVKASDENLYDAKEGGRNRVVFS